MINNIFLHRTSPACCNLVIVSPYTPFDYLDWNRVIHRLEELGCREIELWRSYFSYRRTCVVGNLMMDTLLWQLQPHCWFSAYTDDLLLMVEGRSCFQLEQIGIRLLEVVCQWCNSVGVSVSMDKTVMMLLKGKLS